MIDLVRLAQSEDRFSPKPWNGNAHAATISSQGIEVENYFVEHSQGTFPLEMALAVLLDFWDYCVLTHPEKDFASYCNEYAKENGRDPLAGLRKVSRDVPPQGLSLPFLRGQS